MVAGALVDDTLADGKLVDGKLVGGTTFGDGDVVGLIDDTEYSASNPRSSVCPEWNFTNIWCPLEKVSFKVDP